MKYNQKNNHSRILFPSLIWLAFLFFSCTNELENTRQKRYEELADKGLLIYEYQNNKQFRILKRRIAIEKNHQEGLEIITQFQTIHNYTLQLLAYLKNPQKIDLPTLKKKRKAYLTYLNGLPLALSITHIFYDF